MVWHLTVAASTACIMADDDFFKHIFTIYLKFNSIYYNFSQTEFKTLFLVAFSPKFRYLKLIINFQSSK